MNKKSESIGIVIPAFNEAENLLQVLNVMFALNWIEQIVVVDDGSTDNTLTIAKQYGNRDERIITFRLPQNQGKAAAMLTGVRGLETDLVIFLDADLIGLQEFHLKNLVQPVAGGFSHMSIATFQAGGLLTDASHYFAPYLSGQRCLRREDAERALRPLAHTRYGVETGLTVFAKRQNWAVQKVVWRGVTHRMKEQKRSMAVGMYHRWRMYRQIAIVLAASIPQRIQRRRTAFFQQMNSR